jgi:hypothetical protein
LDSSLGEGCGDGREPRGGRLRAKGEPDRVNKNKWRRSEVGERKGVEGLGAPSDSFATAAEESSPLKIRETGV